MQLELVQKKRNLREAFSCFYAHMKPRAVLRWITGLLLLFWFVTPLYMVVSMGARAHAGLREILRVYPRFMVQEGWLGSATWVTVGLFVLLSPSLLGRIEAFFYAKINRWQPGRRTTLVLADWRLVLYDDQGRQIMALPYNQIQWMERTVHDFVLCVGWRQVMGIPLDDMDPETEEAVEDLLLQKLQSPPPVPVELALPADGEESAPVFQTQVQLEQQDLEAMMAMQTRSRLSNRRTAILLGIQAAALAVILIGNQLPLWSWLVIPLLMAGELFWLRGPGAAGRQLRRALRRQPNTRLLLSGRLRMDHQAVRRDNDQVQSRFEWESIFHAISGPAGLLLLNRQGFVVVFVPARCFESAEQMHTISAWAAGCCAANRAKGKKQKKEKN